MKGKLKNIILYVVLGVLCAGLLISTIVLAVANRKVNKIIKDMETSTYDFYMTLGTMPTLYATINAYDNKNPNTYMWFYRGNTISKEYSADFIHYFSTQSSTNANSNVNYFEIRDKIRDIKKQNPAAKFHLYCDDLRVRFILEFVAAGINFEDLQVTFLSDGTGSYSLYKGLTDETYLAQKDSWDKIVKDYIDNRSDIYYSKYSDPQAYELQEFAFYLSTFSNVNYWIQHPDYLVNTNEKVSQARYSMNIVKKDPKAMYQTLDEQTKDDYQKVVLANALVDSATLHILEEAVEYFDTNLSGRDKEVVLILGTNLDSLEHNQKFIDQTIKFYTPTLKGGEPTKAIYKNVEYDVTENHIMVGDKQLEVGELGVHLFFKGHPAYPAQQDLQDYFSEKDIIVLPHRTPVETLFWMYDVKVGGYYSTSFLSCDKGQAEFFYAFGTMPEALQEMQTLNFFDGTVTFNED